MILTVNDHNTYSINEPDKILAFVSGDAWLDGNSISCIGAMNYLTIEQRYPNLFTTGIKKITFTWFTEDDEDTVEKIKEIMKTKVMELENK